MVTTADGLIRSRSIPSAIPRRDGGAVPFGQRADLGAAAEAMAVPGDPRIDPWSDQARTWQIEQRNQRPGPRAEPHHAPEGEEPAINGPPARDGIHGLVQVRSGQDRKGRRDRLAIV